jgi:hypothetical protein
MYTHVLLITLLTPWYGVCGITMSDGMLNVHRCVTDKTDYTMLYFRSMSDLMMNIHTCVTDNTTYTMLYVRSFQFKL